MKKRIKKIYPAVIIKPFKKKVYNKSWETQKTIQTAALLFFFPPPASKLISPLAVPQWFFCACNLGFSLGKDTGCTQEITQRQPPAITRTHARTHSLKTTNTETTMGGVKDESRGRTARFLPKCHKSCPFFPPRGWRLRRAVAASALMLAKKSLRTFFFFFFPPPPRRY